MGMLSILPASLAVLETWVVRIFVSLICACETVIANADDMPAFLRVLDHRTMALGSDI